MNKIIYNSYVENVEGSLMLHLCLGIATKGDDEGDAVVE